LAHTRAAEVLLDRALRLSRTTVAEKVVYSLGSETVPFEGEGSDEFGEYSGVAGESETVRSPTVGCSTVESGGVPPTAGVGSPAQTTSRTTRHGNAHRYVMSTT
jgi:hypothetical protein